MENRFYKNRTEENKRALRKQKSYCNKLYKRERRKIYSQLNLNNISLFSNKGGNKDNIVLVNGDIIISEDTEITQSFNDFFKNCVNALNITEN